MLLKCIFYDLQMTINTLVFDPVYEGVEYISISDFMEEEQKETPKQTRQEEQDPGYLSWQIFDDVPERHYTIHCNGYFDKNEHELTYESSIRHLTNGERLPLWNNDSSLLNPNEYYATHFRYDFDKRTKEVVTKKFICEAPVGSGKSTAICKWISHHEFEWFMVIVPTVNIAEEFYVKLSGMLNYDVQPKKKHIHLCVNDNAFSVFTKAVYDNVNVIITTYNTAAKCLGDIVEEFYERKMRLDTFW